MTFFKVEFVDDQTNFTHGPAQLCAPSALFGTHEAVQRASAVIPYKREMPA